MHPWVFQGDIEQSPTRKHLSGLLSLFPMKHIAKHNATILLSRQHAKHSLFQQLHHSFWRNIGKCDVSRRTCNSCTGDRGFLLADVPFKKAHLFNSVAWSQCTNLVSFFETMLQFSNRQTSTMYTEGTFLASKYWCTQTSPQVFEIDPQTGKVRPQNRHEVVRKKKERKAT